MYLVRVAELLLRPFVLSAIRFYQKTLSFDHGIPKALFPLGYCRFRPTCSEYAYEAINRYGLFRGGWYAVKRVFRCHPFQKGGFDPVP
jgi:putative membrane protein insertion efficiency factor